MVVRSIHDLKLDRELGALQAAPLFIMELGDGDARARITSEAGWQSSHVHVNWLRRGARTAHNHHDPAENNGISRGRGFVLEWSHPLDDDLGPLTVELHATLHARSSAIHWTLRVNNAGSRWSCRRVVFPQVALSKFDPNAVVLVPSGPGELKHNAWDEPYAYKQPYGQAWCTMQLMAAYAESAPHTRATGLYLGVHDPRGSIKDLSAQQDPTGPTVTLAYDIPASDMGHPGNGFAFSGEAVWRILRGDWFDASLIYRDWASHHANWWPQLGPDGREDTPLWMRELSAWVQAGFDPGTNQGLPPRESLTPVKRFRELVNVPVALHWYGWHMIPFDNDYPHYFPARSGFEEAVHELQRSGVFIMPYINGRLWDTRDHGAVDFEFTSLALPFSTKDEHGVPYIESYGSKEIDGSPVRFAVMCPTTSLWQTTVRDIVMRLINEVGVDGVYIDQVAAAKPMLCMDPSHRHPLGGGYWWNEGYYEMLDRIRTELPAVRMLTTECNAEAFISRFDGYLTWHWQHDGMVPVFPAVYGGTVQTFGRSYTGDALAQRMKAGQQFVFGEQIGWFHPSIADDAETATYLRQIIRLRYELRRYFYAGTMLRPPVLTGLPQVKADWKWQGECWVTTDAVMTGAWALPNERRMALLFTNVSDEPVVTKVSVNARNYGIGANRLQRSVISGPGEPVQSEMVSNRFQREETFAARQAVAWEISW